MRASVRRRVVAVTAAVALGGLGVLGAAPGTAATPGAGTVGPTDGSHVAWDFAPVAGAGLGGTPIEVVCAPGECDKFALTVKLPQADATFYRTHNATLKIHYTWSSPTPTDLDVFAFDPQGNETAGPGKPDTSDSGDNFEDLSIANPQSGVWSIRGDAAAAAVPTAAHAVATLTFTSAPALPALSTTKTSPRFQNYDFPVDYQTRDGAQRPNAGEPSIGYDTKADAAMFMAGTQVTKLTFPGTALPPKATFTDVTPAWLKLLSEDSILFTDRDLHRTWALDFDLLGSEEGYSDDAGANWTPGFATCSNVQCAPDHETLGSGPYHSPAPTHTYPHAVYYCAQQIVTDAYCGMSTDGGQTFSAGQPLWNGACTPIHGHVRVGPTGIAYVPNESCTDTHGKPRQGVAVTTDNGSTWVLHTIPDSGPGSSDPSVAEGSDGTVYFGYQDVSGHPRVAVSHDHGTTWSPSIDVGRFSGAQTEDGMPHGIQNTEFSEIITGSPGRAAFAFLGTGQAGGYQSSSFTGVWYLFVSFTYDGGKTWHTVNATPNDPVQRGCVWNGGGSNSCRNMLDFNDITIDKQGRVLVAYTDGCTTDATYSCDKNKNIDGTCTLPSQVRDYVSRSDCTYAKLSAVVRQWCGKGLLAAYDAQLTAACTKAAVSHRPTTGATGSGSGSLAKTGGTALVPAVGALLTGLALAMSYVRRRRPSAPRHK